MAEKVEDLIRQGYEKAKQEFELETYAFGKYLIEDDTTPEDVKTVFWIISTEDTVLSNLEDSDIKKLLLEFDDAYLAYLMTFPDYKFSFTDELAYAEARMKLLLRLKRAKHGYERRMLATQIREMRYEEATEQRKGGIIGRFFGLR